MVNTPEEHEWSSYQFYIGAQKPPEWLYRDFILGYFGGKVSIAQKGYRNFVSAMVNEKYDSPLDEVALGRNVKIFLFHRYTGEKLKDIGTYFGIGESGVSQASRRVNDKIRSDKKLKRKIDKIARKLNLSRM